MLSTDGLRAWLAFSLIGTILAAAACTPRPDFPVVVRLGVAGWATFVAFCAGMYEKNRED